MASIPVDSWSLSRKGRLRLAFTVPQHLYKANMRLIIAQRDDGAPGWSEKATGIRHTFSLTPGNAKGSWSVAIDLQKLQWHDGRWDIVLAVFNNSDEISDFFEFKFTVKQRRYLYLHACQAYLPDNNIIIPYLTVRRTLAFNYRERTWYDSPIYHTKELMAIGVYRLFKRWYDSRHIWLIYEKWCNRAQDNGFYFFKYCMENLAPAERKRILFVIDTNSPDYSSVEPYGHNVVRFSSFRYYLACLSAEMLVTSESKTHLFPRRSRPSYVKHKLKKTTNFFLQHGVMALKRTDKGLGANGWHPVDYFLVSSERERKVITENFGYDAEHTPVLGLARWDALEDCSDPKAPKILLMPTWREWLDDVSDEEFLQTEFSKNYAKLLDNPRLEEVLSSHNATLQVILHPLILRLQHMLSSENSHVQILDPAEVPLNKIIMGCSAIISDYSSVVWDAVYQDKPALFFQFDREKYLEWTGSYIDLKTDLPGECFLDADSLIDGIENTIERGFTTTEQQSRIASEWFAYRDHDNCQRIYKFVHSIKI